MAPDFRTLRSHKIKDESGVISKVLCVRVLCHLDSSTDNTGHDDGDFGLNVGHIYPVLICFLDIQ